MLDGVTDTLALHHDAVVVDTHNDLLMPGARRPRERQAAYFRDGDVRRVLGGSFLRLFRAELGVPLSAR